MQNEDVDSEWVVILAAAGVLVLGVASAAGGAARKAMEWQRSVEEEWRRIAESLGAALHVSGRGTLSPRRLTLIRDHEDLTVRVETTVPVDPRAPAHTRAFARYALGRGPAFRMVSREAPGAPGVERVVLGDHALAPVVHLAADEPVACAVAWSEAARTLAACFARPLDLRSDGRALELAWPGVELSSEVLSSALSLIGELAGSGVGALRELSRIDGAVYSAHDELERRPVVRVSRGNAEVWLVAEPSAKGPIYVARAALARDVPPFDVHIDARGAVDGTIPAGVIEPEESALLLEIGASRLGTEGDHVELEWEAAPELGRAEAGVRLLAGIAAGSGRQGAFR